MPSPIALFVYNRPEHTSRTLDALVKNTHAAESDLYIFSDGGKNPADQARVEEVRRLAESVHGFKSVKLIPQAKNLGLARSIIDGVSYVLQQHNTVIVLEDDLVTSIHFIEYMNSSLTFYENEERVISIHGYIYPVKEMLQETFFLRGADCWGWATWRRGWKIFNEDGTELLNELRNRNLLSVFDFDDAYGYSKMLEDQIKGLNNSWAVRWYASAFLADRLTLYPGTSLVHNIGLDNSGTHSLATDQYDVKVSSRKLNIEKIPVEENANARQAVSRYLKSLRMTFTGQMLRKVKSLFGS